MSKYILNILTLDRLEYATTELKENYIDRCIDSLILNGKFDEIKNIHIYDAGSSSLEFLSFIQTKYPFITIHTSPKRLNVVDNTIRELQEGLNSGSEWIISVQDDIVCSRNSFYEMDFWLDHAPADAGMLTLWRPYPAEVNSDYQPYNPVSFYGSLFLIFRKDVLSKLLNDPIFLEHEGSSRGDDLFIKGFFMRNPKWKIYGHRPCLVEHLGHNCSTIDGVHSSGNKSYTFRGENWDADVE